jgi:hypothetical protein
MYQMTKGGLYENVSKTHVDGNGVRDGLPFCLRDHKYLFSGRES